MAEQRLDPDLIGLAKECISAAGKLTNSTAYKHAWAQTLFTAQVWVDLLMAEDEDIDDSPFERAMSFSDTLAQPEDEPIFRMPGVSGFKRGTDGDDKFTNTDTVD